MIYLDSNRRRVPPAASVKHWCRRRDRGAGQPGSELFESKPLSQNRGLVVQFYLTDAFLLDTVVRFIEDSLCDGEPAIALLTKSHREGVDQRLALRGLDVAVLLAQGLYVPLDAAETLSKFMVDRWPSEPRFNMVIGDLIGRVAAQGRRPVKIFGEWSRCSGKRAMLVAPSALKNFGIIWQRRFPSHCFALTLWKA